VLGVTRVGRWWLGVTVLLATIAMAKSINLLLLLAYCLLAIFVLNTLAARSQLRRVRARRRLPDLVFAQAPCTVEVEVWNEGRGKAAVRIEDQGSDHSFTWGIGWLFRRSARSFRGTVVLPHRGRYAWGRLVAVSGYPFGLFERRRLVSADSESVIFPALGWLHRGRFLQRLRGTAAEEEMIRRKLRRQPTAQAEFHGLRPFRPGDSPRLIHWRTSARRGELMTREYEDAPGQNLIVVLDTTGDRPGPGGRSEVAASGQAQEADSVSESLVPDMRFEAIVSFAATVCWEWCRRRGDRLVVAVGGPEPVVVDDLAGPQHARKVLEALALAQPSRGTNAAALVDMLTGRPLPAAALVVIGFGPSRLATLLGQRLRRTPVCFDAGELGGCGFYQPPVVSMGDRREPISQGTTS
jgi:uncharacterized protein (DUF58 family)